MSRATTFTSAIVPATSRFEPTSALLPITLLLTIGSLPLPLRIQCTG